MKKIILMLAMLIPIISLSGCGRENAVKPNIPEITDNQINESGKNPNVNESEKGDAEVLDEYAKLQVSLKEEIRDFTTFFYTITQALKNDVAADPLEYGVSPLLENLKAQEDPIASLSYILEDLNDDGINELLIFNDKADQENKNVIISMYTLINDEPYHILNSHVDNKFKLCENNILMCEGMFNEEHIKNYYSLNNQNNLDLIDNFSGDTINYKEIEIVPNPVK